MITLPPALALDARGTSPAARLRRSLFRLLDALDEQRPTGIVRVRAGSAEAGRLVVACGRLCMAIPAVELPVDSATERACADGRAELRALAAAAVAEGRTLRRAVLDSGREVPLREALLEEAAQGLVRIVEACADVVPTLEVATTRDDYDTRLTLGTAEVFVASLRSQIAPCHDLPARSRLPEATVELLLQEGDPGELPYPVAQRGLDDVGVRHVVALIRLATALSLGLEPEIETSDPAGEWTCTPAGSGLLLAKVPPAVRLPPAARRAEPPRRGREHTTGAVEPRAVPTHLAPSVDDIPSGLIWPPLEGRHLVKQAMTVAPAVDVLADGAWQEIHGSWRLHSGPADVFLSLEAARTALLDWARWCAAARARLTQPRCLFAAPAPDGTWRLWQGLRSSPALRSALELDPRPSRPETLAHHLLTVAGALADAHAALATHGLRSSVDTVGIVDGRPLYVGLAPRPGATGAAGTPSLAELLEVELGPAIARLRGGPELNAQLAVQGDASGRPRIATALLDMVKRARG